MRGASVKRRSTVEAERHKLANAALACAVGVCLVYLLVPSGHVILREELIYVGAEAAAAAGIVYGVRRYRPDAELAWLLLAAGVGAFAVGDLIWGIYVNEGKSPLPSLADPFYLSGYVLLAGGFLIAARRRFAERDPGAFLDAFILTASVAIVVWVYMIEPLRASSDASTFATVVSVAYPLADLMLLGVVARFLVGDAWRLRVFRTLALAFALILAGDMATTLDDIGHPTISNHLANTMVLGGVLLFGVAALDPGMRELTARVYSSGKMPGLTRLGLIAAATLLPSAIRITQAIRQKPMYLPATVVATVLIFVAALLRWSGILTDLKRNIGRESRLRRYASELLETDTRPELEALAERAAQDLVPAGRVELLHSGAPGPDDPRRVSAEIAVDGEAVGTLVVSASSAEIMRVREAVPAVANQLALALERERLLETEHRNAQQLAEQNEKLLELDKLKDQFVSTVSHELRTPLTSMMGYLEVTLEGEAGELNDDQKQFLEIVNRNCLRLNRLIDDILFMSRVDSGRLSLDPSWISLAEIAAASVETARFAAEKKQITLVFEGQDGLPTMWGDPIRLTQMIDNLMTNAIKFTPDGGKVTVSVGLRAETLHVEVADSGVGIPEDEVGRLFERFFRASTGTNAPGTGLGLSIVQSIAQVHGGTVNVTSTLGVGTTFHIDLPLPGIPGAPERETTEVAT
jgi:signal transduction histidine kinase